MMAQTARRIQRTEGTQAAAAYLIERRFSITAALYILAGRK